MLAAPPKKARLRLSYRVGLGFLGVKADTQSSDTPFRLVSNRMGRNCKRRNRAYTPVRFNSSTVNSILVSAEKGLWHFGHST